MCVGVARLCGDSCVSTLVTLCHGCVSSLVSCHTSLCLCAASQTQCLVYGCLCVGCLCFTFVCVFCLYLCMYTHTHTHKCTHTYTQANLASFLTAQEPVSTVNGWGDVVKSNGALRLSLPNSSSLKRNFIEMQRGMYPDAKFDILWTDTWQDALSHVVWTYTPPRTHPLSPSSLSLPSCPTTLISFSICLSLSRWLGWSVVSLSRSSVPVPVRVRVSVSVSVCLSVFVDVSVKCVPFKFWLKTNVTSGEREVGK
jgi:hypothetical protein